MPGERPFETIRIRTFRPAITREDTPSISRTPQRVSTAAGPSKAHLADDDFIEMIRSDGSVIIDITDSP